MTNASGLDRAFLILRARKEIDHIKQKRDEAQKHMKATLTFIFPTIMLSIFLIPLGSPTVTRDSWLWNPTLKWGFIYGFVGLCFSSLYKIAFALGHFLHEKE